MAVCRHLAGFAGRLEAPRRSLFRPALIYLIRESMYRSILIVSLLSALAGCAGDATLQHHTPPKDPQDYHGVPTDDRPPQMIDKPGASQ
jgi:hypothetical protein